MGAELFLGHGAVFTAEEKRCLGVQNRCARQIEVVVEQRKPGQAARHHARPVKATPPADNLLLLRATQDVVVIPDQFDVGLVGIRA